MVRFHRTLYGQVLVATAVGVLIGHVWPAAGLMMKPAGDGFIKLVRMIIAPIIFCTVVAGIAGGGSRSVGRAGGLALVYFEVVSTVALAIGLLLVNIVRPGAGMNVNPAAFDATAVSQYVRAGRAQDPIAFVLDIIPTSVVDAFARGDILQVLLFSVLFGLALRKLGGRAAPLLELVEKLADIFFTIVAVLMRAAPIGAFGAMAFTVASFGVASLMPLGKLVACFYATCLLFVAAVLGGIARWHGFGIWRFVKSIKEEIFIAFGTSSSESVLPRIMQKLEDLGVDRSIIGVVIPAGYSFNLDGTAIYLAIATVFIAQATNTPLSLARQLTLLALLLITSKGSAGVAGAALVALAATLSATGYLPVAGVALILGIHRFMGEAMAVTNLIGNGVAAIVVARWCGAVDDEQLRHQLAGVKLVAAEPERLGP